MKRTSSWVSLLAVCAAAAAVVSCAAPGAARAQRLQSAAGAYELEVLVDGAPAPHFFHAGESYVLGHMGQRYTLRVWNRSPRRVEAVVSVDGRDVIDGKPGDFRNKRGYLVPAWGSVDIEGWRLSERQAAAFRFTSVAGSYAGRMGSARNVGVIGVAVFPERERRPPIARPWPDRHPWNDRHRAEGEAAPAASEARGPVAGAAPPAAAPSGDAVAQSSAPRRSKGASERPGLGTEFGESMHAPIQEVHFLRASPHTPAVTLGLRYNDRRGLLAMGVDVDGHIGSPDDSWLRGTADPFPVSQRRYATPPAGWRR